MTIAEQLWREIITKMAVQSGDLNKLGLLPGVNEQQWNQLEQKMHMDFPTQLKELYSVYGGQEEQADVLPFARNLTLLPIESIFTTWQFLNEEVELDSMEVDNDTGIKPLLWNSAWIPIASNGAGDYLCLDTDPDEDGVYGQVLYFWHDWENRSVEADDLFTFIKRCLIEEEG